MKVSQLTSITCTYSIIPVLFLLFCYLSSDAQIQVSGRVVDQTTQQPIEGVHLRLMNSRSGTTTDAGGYFHFKIEQLPSALLASHLSYFEKQALVTHSNKDSLVISLAQRPVELQEVEITEEAYQVFKNKHLEVIDYHFLDSNLLILTYNFNKNRKELILSTVEYDTLGIKDVSNYRKPSQIFKDCLGNCHLLTKDSSYQVFVRQNEILLLHATHWQKFSETLGNCLFETHSHLAFEGQADKIDQKAFHDLSRANLSDSPDSDDLSDWYHFFYFVDKGSGQIRILDQVSEWKKQQKAREYAQFIDADPHSKLSYASALRFAQLAFFNPAYQTVKLLGDSIYYFNHVKSQIDIYNDDIELIRSLKVSYHESKNWKPFIYADEVSLKVYTVFTRGTKYVLAEIDLLNGETKDVTLIDKLFPEKIRIRGGYVYFLYDDVYNVWGTKKLYRGDLSYHK